MLERDLIAEYRQLAADGENFHGLSICQHVRIIQKLVRRFGAVTMLDYGCGRGDAYGPPYLLHTLWGTPMPALYDPAFPGHDQLPDGPFDGVLSSDVLEHIPEEQLPAVVEAMCARATMFVWASVCTRPAKKFFSDGITNMHVCLKPMDWWRELFAKHAVPGVVWHLTETP